jgi:hypothetical protein
LARTTSLTPEIIGRASDLAALTRPLMFIIGVAAAGFFCDSFDIVIVSSAAITLLLAHETIGRNLQLVSGALQWRAPAE